MNIASLYKSVTDDVVYWVDDAGQWTPPWHGMAVRPENAISGRYYKGINILILWIAQHQKGYASGRWATYRQWKEAGCQVREGEKSTKIMICRDVHKKGDDGEEDAHYQLRKVWSVFNAAQVEGDAAITVTYDPLPESTRVSMAEMMISNYEMNEGPEIFQDHRVGFAAYSPSEDKVLMPEYERFLSPERYYATFFHELVHSTGAKHRLDRQFGKNKEDYAFEELVAEIGAAFLCSMFHIKTSMRDDHAAYVSSWLKVLKDDKTAIFRAAALAEKAADHIFEMAAPSSALVQPEEKAA